MRFQQACSTPALRFALLVTFAPVSASSPALRSFEREATLKSLRGHRSVPAYGCLAVLRATRSAA
eukprot:2227938-Pleurochrysis_carterae.AAC.5